MGSEFIAPKFEGGRFNNKSLPLNIASDLFAYEELIEDLAEYLWKKENPNRKSLPPGFTANFDLHIERIEKGSSVPILSLMSAASLAFDAPIQDFHTKARDIVSEVVASTSGAIPEDFPIGLLERFRKIGKSLKKDEFMLLPRAGTSSPAKLDPVRRKALVAAGEKTYRRTVPLEGSVGQIDWDHNSFRLNMSNGVHRQIPADAGFFSSLESLEKLGGNRRHRVTVSAVVLFDSSGNIKKIIEVKSIEVQQNAEIHARINHLSTMADGWLGDGSKAPKMSLNALFFSQLVERYPAGARMPAIFPTPEGNILMEWDAEGNPSLEIGEDRKVAVFSNLDDDEDQEFPISSVEEIQDLLLFIARTITDKK